MKFYCLHIETAAERRVHCESEFSKAGIDVQMVSALDTRMNQIRHQDEQYKIGQLGCYLSHLRLMEEVRRYDHSPAVIFEDDVCLADDFKKKLEEALLTLPDDWEVAYIGWWPEWHNHDQLHKEPVNDHWMRITSGVLWGTHCYMINGRKGGDKLMRVMQPITGYVDDIMLAAIVRGEITGYFLREPLADQKGTFESQTQS
jgi:GR25 family glycosyltransferase involved in LPS biosynthesis